LVDTFVRGAAQLPPTSRPVRLYANDLVWGLRLTPIFVHLLTPSAVHRSGRPGGTVTFWTSMKGAIRGARRVRRAPARATFDGWQFGSRRVPRSQQGDLFAPLGELRPRLEQLGSQRGAVCSRFWMRPMWSALLRCSTAAPRSPSKPRLCSRLRSSRRSAISARIERFGSQANVGAAWRRSDRPRLRLARLGDGSSEGRVVPDEPRRDPCRPLELGERHRKSHSEHVGNGIESRLPPYEVVGVNPDRPARGGSCAAPLTEVSTMPTRVPHRRRERMLVRADP